mmetsp:Transcript_15244/g.25126  ORF Transcript_15244/g.25126 Transcript_15244/m.25126 type:complete len:140 (-) Transcript_15244:2646-3065(-)
MNSGLALVCLLAVASVSQGMKWSWCGADGDPIDVKRVTLTPDPPRSGIDLVIDVFGVTKELLTGGTVNTETSYFKIPLHTETDNWCEVSTCPSFGEFAMHKSAAIPNLAPSGYYSNRVVVLDQNSTQIACVDLTFWLSG